VEDVIVKRVRLFDGSLFASSIFLRQLHHSPVDGNQIVPLQEPCESGRDADGLVVVTHQPIEIALGIFPARNLVIHREAGVGKLGVANFRKQHAVAVFRLAGRAYGDGTGDLFRHHGLVPI
jgi:hypothetical protein